MEMMNYFNSSEIIRITKQLKDLLTQFELVKDRRAKMCAGSYSTHEENILDSEFDPSSYYYLRLLDKSVTITRDYHYKSVPHYLITLENWRPKKQDVKTDCFDIDTNSYGPFEDFQTVKNRFIDYCIYLIQDVFQIEYMYQRELF